jgi:hypothetical protein
VWHRGLFDFNAPAASAQDDELDPFRSLASW